jgi:predicted ABC-type ATPase
MEIESRKLKAILARRPMIIALAGPNGAGKSTFFDAFLSKSGLYFVNADLLALSLGIGPYKAAEFADELRGQLYEQRESFIFETVFSDPVGDKLNFLKEAEKAGYTVLLIFIGVSSPELSELRVDMRAAAGGHDVPAQKLHDRFPRVMNNLKRALSEASNILIFDHSDLDVGYRLVASRENGNKSHLYKPTPAWLRRLLP